MSWTDVFPTFDDDFVSKFQKDATPDELATLDEWCGVAKVINPQEGTHVVSCSLFWKNATVEDGDLPTPTREMMVNAEKLGLVIRYSPWEHYVLPLLEGAAALKETRPDIVFRVYLAADLEFLVEDFLECGCEIMLMRGSSLRHNPGAMWRFLALSEKGRWVTVTDSDRAREVIHDIERTEQVMQSGHGAWRVPYMHGSLANDNHPGFYRPINACQFAAVGGYPMELLMKAFLWHTYKGTMPDQCTIRRGRSSVTKLPIYGTEFPTYGFDEWFLLAVVYPRIAFSGVLSFVAWGDVNASHWLALDMEYVTWANPGSEIFYHQPDELLKKFQKKRKKIIRKESRIFHEMMARKIERRNTPLGGRALPRNAKPATLVVARYSEDLDWLLHVAEDIRIVLYNKGAEIENPEILAKCWHVEELPNMGRESDTYLHHLQNYSHGPDDEWTIFCQGDPFPHSPWLLHLFDSRESWDEVQGLTDGYSRDFNVPGAPTRILEDGEWLGKIPLRTEIYSAHTLDILGWQDDYARRMFHDYFKDHGIERGYNMTGHFLELCGLQTLAREAWNAQLGQFAYGAIFAVRNERLGMIPQKCLPRMRKIACGEKYNGFIFERLWLHFFGMPFIQTGRGRVTEALGKNTGVIKNQTYEPLRSI